MRAIRIREYGGPDILQVEDVPLPSPEAGELLIKNEVIGVNFVDVQHRAGEPYPLNLPVIIGIEAAGRVEAAGPEVTEFRVGDRVAFGGHVGGVYAEYSIVPEERTVPVPDEVSFEQAASCLLQGMTAHALSHDVYPIQKGDVVLVHAAAGGVGLLLVQMAVMRGATLLGTCSTPEKASVVRSMGADHAIIYTEVDFVRETMRLTGGRGVHAVYDSVGKATFEKGIGLLRARGIMVLFGLSSGPIPPFDVSRLSGIVGSPNKGSLFVTWATLNDYAAERHDLLRRAADVFGWLAAGRLKVHVAGKFELAEASQAHRMLESRQTIGKLLLIP